MNDWKGVLNIRLENTFGFVIIIFLLGLSGGAKMMNCYLLL